MKKILNLLGVITFSLVITLTMTVCADDNNGNDSNSNNENESPYLGEEPTLSGKVYLVNDDYDNMKISYDEFKGDLTISEDNLTEKGAIRNGWFSFTLVTPTYLDNIDDIIIYGKYFNNYNNENYENMTISPSTAKGYGIYGFSSRNGYSGNLRKENTQISGTRANFNYTHEIVEFIYVNKDVTISGKGKTRNEDGIFYTRKSTTKDINLELKAGWNAIYSITQTSGSMSETEELYTSTTTCSLGNPNLKWVLYEY